MITEAHDGEVVFKVGDEVYFIDGNMIFRGAIDEIHIQRIKGFFGLIKRVAVRYKVWGEVKWLSSYEVYHKKDDLINSISPREERPK